MGFANLTATSTKFNSLTPPFLFLQFFHGNNVKTGSIADNIPVKDVVPIKGNGIILDFASRFFPFICPNVEAPPAAGLAAEESIKGSNRKSSTSQGEKLIAAAAEQEGGKLSNSPSQEEQSKNEKVGALDLSSSTPSSSSSFLESDSSLLKMSMKEAAPFSNSDKVSEHHYDHFYDNAFATLIWKLKQKKQKEKSGGLMKDNQEEKKTETSEKKNDNDDGGEKSRRREEGGSEKLRLLEVGYGMGGSFILFEKMLGIGNFDYKAVDIAHCKKSILKNLKYVSQRQAGIICSNVTYLSQCNAEDIDKMIETLGTFDIIIDDAGHQSPCIIMGFEKMFSTMLRPGGLYVVEDIGFSMLPRYIADDRKIYEKWKSYPEKKKNIWYLDSVGSLIKDINYAALEEYQGTNHAHLVKDLDGVEKPSVPFYEDIETITCEPQICGFWKYEQRPLRSRVAAVKRKGKK